jgi:hypothetical protein
VFNTLFYTGFTVYPAGSRGVPRGFDSPRGPIPVLVPVASRTALDFVIARVKLNGNSPGWRFYVLAFAYR